MTGMFKIDKYPIEIDIFQYIYYIFSNISYIVGLVMHEAYQNAYFLLQGRNPGGRLNKKDGLTRYGDSHVKDKTS